MDETNIDIILAKAKINLDRIVESLHSKNVLLYSRSLKDFFDKFNKSINLICYKRFEDTILSPIKITSDHGYFSFSLSLYIRKTMKYDFYEEKFEPLYDSDDYTYWELIIDKKWFDKVSNRDHVVDRFAFSDHQYASEGNYICIGDHYVLIMDTFTCYLFYVDGHENDLPECIKTLYFDKR